MNGNPDWDTTIFNGVRSEAKFIGDTLALDTEEGGWWVMVPFLIADLPLSLVADTFLLPWTIPEQYGSRRKNLKALVAAIEAGDVDRAKAVAEAAPEVLRLRADGERTPLHIAVKIGQPDMVDWLASETAREPLRDEYGETPLTQAVEAGRLDLARILLDRGADPNSPCRNSTPLSHAATPELVELLLGRGADVNARDRSKETPLHGAAWSNSEPVAALLLANGADVNARNRSKETPLHDAAEKNSAAVAALLIAKGANVNAVDSRGASPLHVAAREGHLEVAQVLLAHGAIVNARNHKRTSPLLMASRGGHSAMVEFLRGRGAIY